MHKEKPRLTDRGGSILSMGSPPFREGCGERCLGGRPGFPFARITVAGQRRTSPKEHGGTGFAFTPSHPGAGHLNRSTRVLLSNSSL
jgi:hypothetical protein